MGLQEEADKIIEARRKERMNSSIQLTLGKLIAEIESAGVKNGKGEAKGVCFDFGSAIPTVLASWRGSYAELALGYRLTRYDAADQDKGRFGDCFADKLLEELKGAIGKTYEGWKGGDFVMDADTPVWVSNQGNADNTGVIGVLDKGFQLVILTDYCEY